MKYLGIDYGAKRLGISISDAAGTIAFPRATLTNDAHLIPELSRLIEEEKIERIIVGDTRSHGGGENPVTPQAEKFIEEMAAETGKPVSAAFEMWSSIEASRYAPKGKEHDDSAAAAIILQRFLDMNALR